jgi:hypothetical protein
MSQGAFAALLCDHGFTACSKTAVSLAERPKESGVQFTPEARKAAQGLLKSTRRRENRVNGNKTTVWLDDELRAWVQTQAYLYDYCVGEFIRRVLKKVMDESNGAQCAPLQADRLSALQAGRLPALQTEKAASDAATSEAAGGALRQADKQYP